MIAVSFERLVVKYMANKRMFSREIVEYDDVFLDLTPKAKLLYFYMNLAADDEGIVGGSRRAKQCADAGDEELQELVNAGYIFPVGTVYAIRDFWINNNKIAANRRKPTRYMKELSMIQHNPDRTLSLNLVDNLHTSCIQNVDKPYANGMQNVNNLYVQSNVEQSNAEQSNAEQSNTEQSNVEKNSIEKVRVERANGSGSSMEIEDYLPDKETLMELQNRFTSKNQSIAEAAALAEQFLQCKALLGDEKSVVLQLYTAYQGAYFVALNATLNRWEEFPEEAPAEPPSIEDLCNILAGFDYDAVLDAE